MISENSMVDMAIPLLFGGREGVAVPCYRH